MASHRAPKQWCLTKQETVNTFENWRQNLLYVLSLDTNFTDCIAENVRWQKKAAAHPQRGLTNDADPLPAGIRHTAQQKVYMLQLMLGQIANYCPIISRNIIVKKFTSLTAIWLVIRLHYGFQFTGAHFIDFTDIRLEPDEDLFQRLVAFVDDKLLRSDGNISHHDQNIVEDEKMTPTLEIFVVPTWLRLIHVDLARLVKQR